MIRVPEEEELQWRARVEMLIKKMSCEADTMILNRDMVYKAKRVYVTMIKEIEVE